MIITKNNESLRAEVSLMDLQERSFLLTLKWLELSDAAKSVTPSAFADKYVKAHGDILRVLMDNEPPESIDASSLMDSRA
jgi:hypothetical protein